MKEPKTFSDPINSSKSYLPSMRLASTYALYPGQRSTGYFLNNIGTSTSLPASPALYSMPLHNSFISNTNNDYKLSLSNNKKPPKLWNKNPELYTGIDISEWERAEINFECKVKNLDTDITLPTNVLKYSTNPPSMSMIGHDRPYSSTWLTAAANNMRLHNNLAHVHMMVMSKSIMDIVCCDNKKNLRRKRLLDPLISESVIQDMNINVESCDNIVYNDNETDMDFINQLRLRIYEKLMDDILYREEATECIRDMRKFLVRTVENNFILFRSMKSFRTKRQKLTTNKVSELKPERHNNNNNCNLKQLVAEEILDN